MKLSTLCSATYLLLTAARRPPPLEAEVDPVSASQLLEKGVYPLSRRAAAKCISCARLAIPVSWSLMAKPPFWGSMPVMRCSLSVQAACPWRRRSVSGRDQSGGTKPLRRFQERSQRTSPAATSGSQLSLTGIAAGSAGAARSPRVPGAMGCGEPAPRVAHRRASPRGPDPWWAALPATGTASAASSPPSGAATLSGTWGEGALGVWGVSRRPPCPSLEDVGGRLLVFRRGGGVQRVPRQVLQHRPACVELVWT